MNRDAGLIHVNGAGEGRRIRERVSDCGTVYKSFSQAHGESLSESYPSEEAATGRNRSDLEPAVLSPWLGVAQGMCGLGVNPVKPWNRRSRVCLSATSAPCRRRSQWHNSMAAQQAERAREEEGRGESGEPRRGSEDKGSSRPLSKNWALS